MRKKRLLARTPVLLCMLLATLFSYAQNKTVTGKVTDAKDGSPLAGVSVVPKGSTKGTTSGADGSFHITVPAATRTLIFSSIGFGTRQIDVSEGVIDADTQAQAVTKRVLVVDDSSVARKQLIRCLETVGVEVLALNDGRQALDYLQQMLAAGGNPGQELLMVISDIEMPEMDGYTLTAEIRHDPRLQDLHILLHTSLSGVFNQAMVRKVGANDFLAKFRPDDLAARVVERIKAADAR